MPSADATPAEARLSTVPWLALAGLAPPLDAPLGEVLSGAPAERALDRLLRAHRDFSAPQRQVCAEAVFGVGLWRRRLRAQCGLAAPTPLQLLGCLARDLGGCADAPALLGVALPAPRPPPADWRDRHSVPDWLALVLEQAVGAEAPALAAALNLPGPICLRANRPRVTREALAERLRGEGVETRPGAWAPDCLVVATPRPNLLALAAAREGLFEVQDEGSQVLGALVDARAGDDVLDLCAGAGGKALQLAATAPKARVFATDVDLARLERLRTRAERAGAVVHLAGRAPPAGRRFDRVLVDAPCSELGALRRGPDLRWRLDPAGFPALEQTQRALLSTAAPLVKPGGTLVYATCTLRREENDAQVFAFLASHADFRRVEALRLGPSDAAGFLRTYPHRHGLDGFFAAVLERR